MLLLTIEDRSEKHTSPIGRAVVFEQDTITGGWCVCDICEVDGATQEEANFNVAKLALRCRPEITHAGTTDNHSVLRWKTIDANARLAVRAAEDARTLQRARNEISDFLLRTADAYTNWDMSGELIAGLPWERS